MNGGSQRADGWLPALIHLADCGGQWQLYEDVLYRIFSRDFIESHPNYPNRRWSTKRYPESKGKACTFWHLISTGDAEAERIPDMRRCERIPWPRVMIDAVGTRASVRIWQVTQSRRRRVLLAIDGFSYVVVLEDRGEHIMLWTAYHVEHSNRRRQLRKQWEAYEQTQNERA